MQNLWLKPHFGGKFRGKIRILNTHMWKICNSQSEFCRKFAACLEKLQLIFRLLFNPRCRSAAAVLDANHPELKVIATCKPFCRFLGNVRVSFGLYTLFCFFAVKYVRERRTD